MKKNLILQGTVHGWLFLNRQGAEGYFTSPRKTGRKVEVVQPGEGCMETSEDLALSEGAAGNLERDSLSETVVIVEGGMASD